MRRLLVSCIVLTVAAIACPRSSGQVPDSVYSYYPLHISNKWEYDWRNYTTVPPTHMKYTRTEVVGDSIMGNGLHYFVVRYSDLPPHSSSSTKYERIDSADGYVHQWTGSSDSRTATYLRSSTAFTDSVFGAPMQVRVTGYVNTERYLAYGLGVVRENDYASGWPYRSRIFYARVNGTEYGTPLSLRLPPSCPEEYALYQNYPNPFNPSTTITYSLLQASYVTLLVYTSLGQEIDQLVHERQQAGSHQVFFHGDRLASGVYFYRLIAGDFIETKGMLIIR